jgi:PAS domain S-box-containing protein
MKRILIVDDKPENLYLLSVILRGYECVVDEARHGAEALVKAHQQPPDLIISDLLMPVMDGYTLMRHWKADELLKAIPFVVYTATYTEPKDEKLALDLGADAFILKPTEPEPFMARLREVLAKAQCDGRPATRTPKEDDETLLKDYGEILIRKLEEKAFQLEQANRTLQEDIVQRQQAEAEAKRNWEAAEKARQDLLRILQEQRQTEAARARLLHILESSLNEIYVFDAESLRFEYVNQGALRNLGYTLEALRTMTPLALKPEFTEASLRQAIAPLLRHEQEQLLFHTVHRRADGSLYPIEVHLQLVEHQGQRMFLAVILDITERKRAEEQIQQQLVELRRWHEAMLGRETRVLALKKEVNRLLGEAGKPVRYPSAETEGGKEGDG